MGGYKEMHFKKVLSLMIIIAMITTGLPGPQYGSYADENVNVVAEIIADNILVDSGGLFEESNSTTEALVTITPSLNDMLSGNRKYIDLSDVEKAYLCSTLNLTDQELTNPLIIDFNLKYAVKVTSIAKISNVELKSVIQFSQFITEDRKLNEQMLLLGKYQSEYSLLSQDIDEIVFLNQSGYELYAATVAVAASKVLNLPVENIIKDEFNFDSTIDLEENEQIVENENDQNLLDQFHLDAAKVRTFDPYTEMTNLEIFTMIEETLIRKRANLTNGDFQTSYQDTNATTDSNQNQILPGFTKEVTAPFAFNQNQNQISPSNGSVVSMITPYTLPGRNGLDVTLSPTYSSANAGAYAEDYLSKFRDEYSYTQYTIYKLEYIGLYSLDGIYLGTISQTYNQISFTSEDVAKEHLDNWKQTSILERNDDYVVVLERSGEIYASNIYELVHSKENITNQQTYTSKYNNLGLGWSWGLPSIELDSNTNTRYLHLGDGQVYQITEFIESGSTNLINYPHKDLKFQDGSLYTQVGSNTKSSSYVTINTGTKYHFASNGTLLAIEDRYGNKIDYFYEDVNGSFMLKRIVDTIGRQITFEDVVTSIGKDVIVTFPDQRKLVYRLTKFDNFEDRFLLSEFIDPNGNSTNYQYQVSYVNFSYFSTTDLSGNNTYALLSNVIYYTGGNEQFTYEKAYNFLASSGKKELYRATKHDVIDTATIKSSLQYTYSTENASGYPNYQTEIPEYYTFETTITDENTKNVLTFNKWGLNIKDSVYTLDNKLLRENRFTYGTNKLPSKREYDSFNPLNGLKSSHSETMTYDIYGNLTTFIDGLGNKTEYSYYEMYNLPKKIVQYDGSNILKTVEYGQNFESSKNTDWMKVTNIVDGVDKSVLTSYMYDSYGNTIKSTTQVGNEVSETVMEYSPTYQNAYVSKITTQNKTNKIVNGAFVLDTVPSTIKYEYDFNSGWLSAKYDESGTKTTNTYDKLGRITKINVGGIDKIIITYDDVNKQTVIRNEVGLSYKYAYTPLGRVKSITNLENNATSTFEYDTTGQLIKTTDPLGASITYGYDALGRLISTKYPDQTEDKVIYSDDTRSVVTVDASGIETFNQVDALGRNIKVGKKGAGQWIFATSTYDALGRLTRSTDFKGSSAEYKYDALGNLLELKNALGQVTKYKYGILSLPVDTTAPNGATVKNEYDTLGRLIKTINPLGEIEQFAYDNRGNVIYAKDRKGVISTFEYDLFNRKTKQTVGSKTTTYKYDALNNITQIQDASGVINQTYSLDGMLLSKQLPDGKTISYAYDLKNRLVKTTDYFGQITTYTYNQNDLLISEKIGAYETKYSYYPNGRLYQTQFANGIKEQNTYDSTGLLIQRKYLNPSASVISSFSYTYDANGNRITENGDGGAVTYTYDALNRLVREEYPANYITFSYDSVSNIIRKEYITKTKPETNNSTTYFYDLSNKLIKKDTVYEYIQNSSVSINVTHNFSGVSPVLNVGDEVTLNLIVKNTDNLPVPYSEYSKMGIAVTSGSNSMIGVQIDSSQLNVNGTIKVKYKQAYTMSYMTLRFYMNGKTSDFRILLNKPAGPVKPPTPKPIPVDPPTEPMSFSVVSDDPGVIWVKEPVITISKSTDAFVYDPNGNLTKQSTTENNQTTHKQYGYNENNQLISYIAPDGSASSYTYYADGLRKSKTVQNQTTTFYYHGDDIINEAIAGQLTATNLKTYGMMGRITPNGYRSYVKDGHGDVVKMLNAQGTQVASYQYEGYGLLTSKTGSEPNPFRYSGEYLDLSSGTYYLRARYYDPTIGRFLSEDTHWNTSNSIYGDDPLMLNKYTAAPDIAAITQSSNLYAYCGNNPIIYVDKDGHIFMLVTAAIGAVVGGAVGAISSYAKTGSVSWKSVAVGAAIGGATGLTGGAAAAYVVAGSATASTGAVMTGLGIAGAGAAGGSGVALGTQFDNLGKLVSNPKIAVDWANTTAHGLERMAEREVTQKMVQTWMSTGKVLQQTSDKFLYITQQGAVVVNKAGQVITAYGSKYFDSNMKEVVKQLFGK